jgi:endonuclease YncB( thermonuclease family)
MNTRTNAILAGIVLTGACASLAISDDITKCGLDTCGGPRSYLAGQPFVIDGDTIVLGQTHIRLWGIDAPEKNQPFGPQAKQALQNIIDGPLVCKQKAIDKYKRVVAQCFVDKKDIGSAMVAFGYAWDYPQYSKGYYKQEQVIAQKEHRGLWQQSNPQPPWEFRHGHN